MQNNINLFGLWMDVSLDQAAFFSTKHNIVPIFVGLSPVDCQIDCELTRSPNHKWYNVRLRFTKITHFVKGDLVIFLADDYNVLVDHIRLTVLV